MGPVLLLGESSANSEAGRGTGRSVRAGVSVPALSPAMEPGGRPVTSHRPLWLSPARARVLPAFPFLRLFVLRAELSAARKFTAGIKPSRNRTVSR